MGDRPRFAPLAALIRHISAASGSERVAFAPPTPSLTVGLPLHAPRANKRNQCRER
jgi:hypothetical protein